MKLTNFARLFGKHTRIRSTDASRRRARGSARLRLEGLEERAVPAVLPAVTNLGVFDVSNQKGADITTQQAEPSNENSPAIAIDPINPHIMVAAWHRTDPTLAAALANGQTGFTEAAISSNDGATWTPLQLPLNDFDPANPTVLLAGGSSPSVAIDRSENIYIVYSQFTGTGASGVLKFLKFTKGSTTPSVNRNLVYPTGWQGGREGLVNATVAVDTNLPSFTDPTTNAVQADPNAQRIDPMTGLPDPNTATVFIAFNRLLVPPTITPGANIPPFPNGTGPIVGPVGLMVSSDSGATWSPSTFLSQGGVNPIFPSGEGAQFASTAAGQFNEFGAPKIVISQGSTTNTKIVAGQLSAVFGAYQATPAPANNSVRGEIISAPVRSVGGISEQTFSGTGGLINDATAASIPQTNTFTNNNPNQFINSGSTLDSTIDVTTSPPILQNISVSVNLTYSRDQDLRLILVAPNGQQILLSNQNGSNGANYTNTNFVDGSPSITTGNPPFTGNFAPQFDQTGSTMTGALVNGGAPANGTWHLLVQNLGTGLSGVLNSWSLTITAADAVQGVTDFIIPVNVSQPNFTTISNLAVGLNIQHPDFGQLRIELIAPDGRTVVLVDNREFPNGSVRPNNGLSQAPGISGTIMRDTVFDMAAFRNIVEPGLVGTPVFFSGEYQPESALTGVSPTLALFNGLAKNDPRVNGNWTLRVIDFVRGPVNPTPSPQVLSWSLVFTSGLSITPPPNNVVATDLLDGVTTGAPGFTPPVSPAHGISPDPVIAMDNTLGSFSPFQGNLYIAYTDAVPDRVTGQIIDDTNVLLSVSSDGGVTWSSPIRVNNDTPFDGFSEGNRPQFEPAIAVDQSTGTLVITFYDTRQDASHTRVATYVATSIDGGKTFGPETYANPSQMAFDEITRQNVALGPASDNESAGSANPAPDDFGTQQGLAVVGGKIHVVWPGNQNGALDHTTQTFRTLDIWHAELATAAGPRIISSTMGTVQAQTVGGQTFNNTFAADGTQQVNGFAVTFDRPVDPGTFDPSKVTVIYRNTITPPSMPGTMVAVGSVTPLNPGPFGATQFLVRFATPQSGTGTYSYSVGPNVTDRIRTIQFGLVPVQTLNQTSDASNSNLPVPPDQQTGDTGGPNSPPTQSTISITGVPFDQVVNSAQVTVNINHTFDSDLVITLIAPDGTRILLSNKEGGSSQNYTGTIFTDSAPLAISQGSAPFTGPFRPEQPLAPLQGKAVNGTWTLLVQDVATGDTGILVNWTLTIQTAHQVPTAARPGNQMDENANGVAGEPQADAYAAPRSLNGIPFQAPYDQNTLPIVLPGPHVASTSVPGTTPSQDNLALNRTVSSFDVTFDRDMQAASFTPAQILRIMGPAGIINGPFTVTPNPNGTDPDPSFPRTFRIGFPTQQLSGTYTIQLASSIKAKNGDALDTNLNAGVDNLRSVNSGGAGSTAIKDEASGTVNVTIRPGKTVTSVINVTDDSFVIKDLAVRLNITYPNDPELTATLTAPDGTQVLLFNHVGAQGGQNFSITVLSDGANTPIQTGTAPFNGSFNPQTPLGVLRGKQAAGTWTLSITSNGTQNFGNLASWDLLFTKDITGTGLGEPVADIASVSFRIFTMDVNNPLNHNTWTAVGPAAVDHFNSGRIGGIAVDPSDPSGNTVYVAGGSGGIWKTTNFLTVNIDPQTGKDLGPTYIPLTDFGPTFGTNVGGLAVFGRNNDPKQSVIFAVTGEGDVTSNGVGFLRSMDGGATWTLLDSTTNVDAGGNPLPLNSPLRDHMFVGTTGFKVVVDPTAGPGGNVIVYAAISDTTPTPTAKSGIWRSIDSGMHWTKMISGEATDVLLAADSGTSQTKNLQVVFAGLQGQGVFLSPNQGQTWQPMAGGVGDPLILDTDNQTIPFPSVPVAAPTDTPNGNKGRIVLAAPPFLTGDPLKDKLFEGWLYAAVVSGNGLNGLYLTKDFGQNWTKIRVPDVFINGVPTQITSNDTTKQDLPLDTQGNYDISLGVDPTNPNIVYVGGNLLNNSPVELYRVDTTGVLDPHALIGYSFELNNGGQVVQNESASGGIAVRPPPGPQGFPFFDYRIFDTDSSNIKGQILAPPPAAPGTAGVDYSVNPNFINLLRDPNQPFLSGATILASGINGFNNTGGFSAKWTNFDAAIGDATGSTLTDNQHRIVSMIDPLTGHGRMIFGDDNGVFTGVDDGTGNLVPGIGTQRSATFSRSGNLQIAQFYYGAAQPSVLAEQVAQALFYGNSQSNGQPQSDPNILSTGNLDWTNHARGTPTPSQPLGQHEPTIGVGAGIATDQTGSGTEYQFVNFLDSLTTNFFQVELPNSSSPIGRTSGLLLAANDTEFRSTPGSNFSVNPVDGNEMVMGSSNGPNIGHLFRTQDQGVTWFVIATPQDLDGTEARATAYGAPLVNQVGNLDNFIYAGTQGGKIFVTFNGGGNGAANAWIDISNGLDGSAIQAIVADPVRGSHDAFAVTLNGVYRMFDSSATNPSWVNITGNLFNITHNTFINPALQESQAKVLHAIAADWRFRIKDSSLPNSTTHPVLYVGGEGGVYRSKDGGVTWTLFPDVTDDGSPINGGFLPNADVTDLELSLGNINSTTGQPDQSQGLDMLVATTFGRGTWAIFLPNNAAAGPRVISFQPNLSGQTVSSVTVTFDKSVAINTFTTSDISVFRGPNGPISLASVTITDTDPTAHKTFVIAFPTQSTFGTYTLTFGPDIRDFSGDQMDQNGNGINGEVPADSFTGHFTLSKTSVPPEFAVGADAGGGPEVKVIDSLTNHVRFDFYAYAPQFTGGVRVAMADVNGDGVSDIITAPGPGGGPDIRVFDGVTGAIIREFYAYDPLFTGGAFVAGGDVNADGFADIITGAGPGGGPHVKAFSGKDGSLLMSFMAYSSSFTGGVNVAAGDVNGDGFVDIVTGAGPGGGPHVKVFSGKDGSVLQSFLAGAVNQSQGVNVALADVTGSGRPAIVTALGAGAAPQVKVYDALNAALLRAFMAFDAAFLGGVRVGGVADLNGDGNDEIIAGPGPGGGPNVRVFDGGPTLQLLDSFYAYDPKFTGGVFVGGH
jgi:subtilisin-like proprotein convertase family protein